MSKVKNISGGQLDVPVLGRVVDDGETVDVPDFQADGTSPIVWPPNRWEAVKPRTSAKTADDTSGKAM